ncbi:hypothetical protein QYF36_008665 [Acer negundo]|nr:hypothetical protein QYF36_008665 [Acer negundo]
MVCEYIQKLEQISLGAGFPFRLVQCVPEEEEEENTARAKKSNQQAAQTVPISPEQSSRTPQSGVSSRNGSTVVIPGMTIRRTRQNRTGCESYRTTKYCRLCGCYRCENCGGFGCRWADRDRTGRNQSHRLGRQRLHGIDRREKIEEGSRDRHRPFVVGFDRFDSKKL